MSSLTELTVLGAGVLGGQIAWHSAYQGKNVVVFDISEDALERCRATHEGYADIYRADLGAGEDDIAATRGRLTYTSDLAQAVHAAEIVIEAVPEVPEIKTSVYTEMAPLLPPETVVATNTSTFLPSDFADATGRPDRFCALHFAVGVWMQNFAEIMVHERTSRDTATAVTRFAIEIGMVPIPVLKERSGYVVNAWVVPLLNAAQTLVTNGIATAEDVDRTFMVNGASYGPMGMFDMIGMKTAYDVLSYWGQVSGDAQMRANADYLKTRFLDEGLLGLQTAEGYYRYPDPAYRRPDFLAVPDVSVVPGIVDRILPG